jgi:heterotetrameric sarcosine oxidase gamma subunit
MLPVIRGDQLGRQDLLFHGVPLRLSGPRARDVLAKGLAIDLDPRVFPAGSAATSALSHMGVLVWRGEAETYDIVLFRSVAESFWRWLSASAAEYGYDVVTTS